jgi:Enoyl-(Acyl carrier protein) reductase
VAALALYTIFQGMPIPYIEPEDMANLGVFLASDDCRYITGQQIRVDAGSLLKWPNGPRRIGQPHRSTCASHHRIGDRSAHAWGAVTCAVIVSPASFRQAGLLASQPNRAA